MSISLTTVATAAAQFLGVLDSGEGLSAQQLIDARLAANGVLDNWTVEQVNIINALVANLPLAAGVYTPVAVLQFADATTPITLPAGYTLPLELELAIILAPQYDVAPSAALAQSAAAAKARMNPIMGMIRSIPVPESPG